jgi:hypothetical protein
MYQPSEETAGRARAVLASKIDTGRTSALDLFDRVHREAPRDTVLSGQALRFEPGDKELRLGFGTVRLGVHKHALGQMAQRAGIPGAYLADLAEAGGWQGELAAEVLNRHYHQGQSTARFLVREVQEQARGFLSNRYRRLDSRPLLEAFAEECQSVGAIPVEGTCSDTRVALKALVPQVYEPVPGEVMAFGVEWHNSDFGAGSHALRAFMLRVACLNGATMENSLAQVHLGGRLGEDIELSQRTYELDTRTSISALRDVVRGVLAPRKIKQLCAGIQRAHEHKVEWKHINSAIAKKLLKGELQAAKEIFESDDIVNLPAGNTTWRASNALSWIAGKVDNPDRKLELQKLAGQLVSGRREVETVQ